MIEDLLLHLHSDGVSEIGLGRQNCTQMMLVPEKDPSR